MKKINIEKISRFGVVLFAILLTSVLSYGVEVRICKSTRTGGTLGSDGHVTYNKVKQEKVSSCGSSNLTHYNLYCKGKGNLDCVVTLLAFPGEENDGCYDITDEAAVNHLMNYSVNAINVNNQPSGVFYYSVMGPNDQNPRTFFVNWYSVPTYEVECDGSEYVIDGEHVIEVFKLDDED